jgi:hypothetical protein
MKKLLTTSIIILIITCFSFHLAAGDKVSVTGYYKLFFTGFKMPAIKGVDGSESEPPIGSVNNRVRLKLTVIPADWLTFHAAYDISPRIQDPVLFEEDIFFAAIDPFSYRVDDFSQRLYPGVGEPVSSLGVFHNLDRFFVTIKTSKADIFIGRQAIAWGSARFVNPTDVIAPFAFNELDTEERRGVDAVRVRVPLGMMSELDMGYIFGRKFKFENSAFYLRGKTYVLKTDLSVLLVGFRENLLIGLDVARSIGSAGFWCESAYVVTDAFKKDDGTGIDEEYNKNYFRGSVGMDYNFSGNVYGFFEYHFNSAGRNDSVDYPDVFYSTAYTEGAAYLMAKHYLNLGVTAQITPLIPFTGILIFNLNDRSLNFAPSIEYNIKEDIYIAAGAYLGIGKRPEICDVCNPALQFRFHSEFGAYPNMVYSSLRIYF